MRRGEPVILTDLSQQREALARVIAEAGLVAGFTGAGISTECGIPDFRSPGSPWLQNKPIDFDLFVSSEEMRREAWRRKFTMDDLYRGARPGRGHRALAALAASARMPALITQNIDGLHQASGIPDDRVIELHGNGTYAKCLSCEARAELADVRAAFEANGKAPTCACGGLIKSATISFGQAMPEGAMGARPATRRWPATSFSRSARRSSSIRRRVFPSSPNARARDLSSSTASRRRSMRKRIWCCAATSAIFSKRSSLRDLRRPKPRLRFDKMRVIHKCGAS
jgi:NAD-dependent deacetylase